MFFKPQPGLGLQYPICADMLLSTASCHGAQLALVERKRKEKKNSAKSESQVVTLLPAVAVLRAPLASLSIKVGIFFEDVKVPFVYACSFSRSNAPDSPGIVIRGLG